MKPYYDDGTCVIYHGDFADCDVLARVDCVITDPPYGMGTYEWDRDQNQALAERVETPLALFGYPERLVDFCIKARWLPDEWVTWWPTNAAIKAFGLHGLLKEVECIAIFGASHFEQLRRARNPGSTSDDLVRVGYGAKDKRLDHHGTVGERRLGDCWTDPAPGLGFNSAARLHPNEKPVSLMRRLVEGMTRPGEVVLDPFMGSGSTLRAAKDLGRRAIGVELDERYCEVAANRLAQEVLDFGAVS